MNKAKIFILAWAFFLLIGAVGFYVYTVMFGRPKIPKLDFFSSEKSKIGEKTEGLLEGWLGKIGSEKDKDLYPAKEADIHIDLGEKEKYFVITVEKLTSASLGTLEEDLKRSGLIYSVSKATEGFVVDITFRDKTAMLTKLETIKQLKFDPKTR
jgi:hypothetical protein